jgi:hypothetical protein
MNWLLSLLTGPVLNAITGPIVDVYKAKLAAANNQDKVAVDLAIKAIEAEIDARKQATAVMIADNGHWWTSAPRALVMWSLAIYIATLLVWDNVLGLGSHDPLRGDLHDWASAIIVMWFGGRTIEKVTQIVANRFGK